MPHCPVLTTKQNVDRARQHCVAFSDDAPVSDTEWRSPLTGNRKWAIVSPLESPWSPKAVPASSAVNSAVQKCRACRKNKTYADPGLAVEHFQKHVDATRKGGADVAGLLAMDPKDWIRDDGQIWLEERNADHLAVLSKGVEQTKALLCQVNQLAKGVLQADGLMSDRYSFPYELLQSLRRLVTYFVAVECATSNSEDAVTEAKMEPRQAVYSRADALESLTRFCDSAMTSLLAARRDLCIMVRSDAPTDVLERLALEPEYLVAWVMRRLLVKPVVDGMRVADLYRSYLSTLVRLSHQHGLR